VKFFNNQSDKYLIRDATPEDATSIAGVHIRSWQWAYAELIPQWYLDSLSDPEKVSERIERWRTTIENKKPKECLLVLELDGVIHGFCFSGTSRNDTVLTNSGEIYAIYFDKEGAGRGYGKLLFSHVLELLRSAGFRRMMLWVLISNASARRFYEQAGLHMEYAFKNDEREGVIMEQIRYAIWF